MKILGLLFITASIILIFYELSLTEKNPPPNNLQNQNPEKILDQHLKETSENVYTQRRDLENQKALDEQKNFEKFPNRNHLEKSPIPLELNTQEVQERVLKDLKNDQMKKGGPTSPEEYLHYQLFMAEEQKKWNEAYKEEYARLFIENARQDGWMIKMDSNFKITSVKRILPKK